MLIPTLFLLATTVGGVTLVDPDEVFKTGGVSVEYDRFTQSRTILGLTRPSATPHLMLAHIQVEGKSETVLMFTFRSDTWKYIRCSSNNYLVNGKPFPLPGKYKNDMSGVGVTERFEIKLTPGQLQQLSVAKSFEYQFCNDEYAASAEDLKLIADFRTVLLTP